MMKVYDGLDAVTVPFPASSVAIGTFDGVHVGHQAIIRTAVEDARRHDRPALVFTFDRHPIEFFAPERAPALITTPPQRHELIADLGADGLVIARFDVELAELSPDAFVQRILKGQLGAKAIVEGSTFNFGKDRAGDVAYLERVQAQYDFVLRALEPVLMHDLPASSTRVRERLQAGDIAEAEAVLGIHIFWRELLWAGSDWDDAWLPDRQSGTDIPADGSRRWHLRRIATLDDGRTSAARAAWANARRSRARAAPLKRFCWISTKIFMGAAWSCALWTLRAEEKFDSLDALVAQMARDVAKTRELLATRGK